MESQITVRTELRPGDIGRLVEYAGIYGSADFGYPLSFEGYVAKTFAEFLIDPQPRNRIWIAEDEGGSFVGSVGVVDRGETAQLRWFNLDPKYRGRGIGGRLFNDAMQYCREAGFKKAWLSTFTESDTAIGIYRRRGFNLIEEKPFTLEDRALKELIFEKIL
ncbi:GNAT family N-acetyltransferase [uncultured Parasutterella sp.]|uniref:GNAT family N-acetyltransferase n=1 Tax=uncultured Parasutterella sp. TaxID=1263098 RepID=UPI0025957B48|nr:GNAT family N-acetyltransferase [uncultured Parasutterella sp.]